jgi:hypothetical protein
LRKEQKKNKINASRENKGKQGEERRKKIYNAASAAVIIPHH